MEAPELIETERLILRRPRANDAEAIFARYANDLEVTRYLSWPRHTLVEQTRGFLSFAEQEWRRWPGGPYLIESRESGMILGGTGFAYESQVRAAIGYVLARDAWGHGYSTEAVRALTLVGPSIRLRQLVAYCHPEHEASCHVLEKCSFTLAGRLERHAEFPNLEVVGPMDVLCYSRTFD